ncbi:MAG TPA: prohibitin family protein [Prolixibacteraceae bacterium]|nr:prohibitin family protein [Prolixibacteraceae bacterium]
MNNKKTTAIIIGVIALMLLLVFGNKTFVILKETERAILFRPFSDGLSKDRVFEPGFHIIAPWNRLIKYEVAEQQQEEQMDVLDKNGLSVNLDITVRFLPIPEKVGYLHEQFKGYYVNNLVKPEVRSSVRKVTGRYTAEEIYSTKRNEVEKSIIEETGAVLNQNNIHMRALLIRSINLPTEIKNAIESKLKQEQEALAYRFRLERERSEAERMRIEAQGIADYNMIINSSLTSNVLKQQGIQATLKLAESPNSKVVIVGSGKEGLPLILGNN